MEDLKNQKPTMIAPFGEDSAFRALAILLMFICLVFLAIMVGLCGNHYITQAAPKLVEGLMHSGGDPGMAEPGMMPPLFPIFPLIPKWICFFYVVAILVVVYTVIVFYKRVELILIRCRVVIEQKLPNGWLWRIYCVITRIVIWIAYVVVLIDLIWVIRIIIVCFRIY